MWLLENRIHPFLLDDSGQGEPAAKWATSKLPNRGNAKRKTEMLSLEFSYAEMRVSSTGHAKPDTKKPCLPKKAWLQNRKTTEYPRKLFVSPFQERFTDNVFELLKDLELAISLGLANEDVLGEVMILLRSHFSTRTIE
jgi:hypothetical protein